MHAVIRLDYPLYIVIFNEEGIEILPPNYK